MITSTIALFNWIIIGLGVYFFCLSASNAIWLAKESRPAELTDGSFVSALIPARDEEAHIEQCIQSLMNQTYTNYETVFLNFREAASCRMYTSWQNAVNGISKNIFDFINKNHILIIVAVLGIFIFLTVPPFLAAGLTVYTLIGTKTVLFTLVALWINLILVGGTWAVVFRTNGIDKSIYIRYYLPIYYMLRLSYGFIP